VGYQIGRAYRIGDRLDFLLVNLNRGPCVGIDAPQLQFVAVQNPDAMLADFNLAQIVRGIVPGPARNLALPAVSRACSRVWSVTP
jgi:hypothetical protein